MIRHIFRLISVPYAEINFNEVRKNISTSAKRVSYECVKLIQEGNTKPEHHRSFRKYTKDISNLRSLVSNEEFKTFMSVFPEIVSDLTNSGCHTSIPVATKQFARALQYNVPNGTKTRGFTVVDAYKAFELPEKLTSENMKLAMVLGWCVEMLNASFKIVDDIIDAAENRSGFPCWYRSEKLGLKAINDAVSINHAPYIILKKYLSNHIAYVPILELFHDVTLRTSFGEALNMMSAGGRKPQLDSFTMNKYKTLAKYKTAYYTFYLPLALAMYLARIFEEEIHRQVEDISLEMGYFFRVKNDYEDCFGNSDLTGKDGTDIKQGACTWLIVEALQRVTPVQRQLLDDHYGKGDNRESQEAVRKLYKELSLPNVYACYKKDSYNQIRTRLDHMPKELPPSLFSKLIKHLYEEGFYNVETKCA